MGVEGWLAHTDTNTCAHVPLNLFKLSILTRINIYIEIKFVFTSTNIIILLLSFVDVIKATCWSSNWASASEEIGFDAVKPFVNIFWFFNELNFYCHIWLLNWYHCCKVWYFWSVYPVFWGFLFSFFEKRRKKNHINNLEASKTHISNMIHLQGWVTFNVACLLVHGELVWVFQTLLVYWDFPTQTRVYRELYKKTKYPIIQWADSFKLIWRQQ